MRKELFENFYSKIKFNESNWCWDWLGSLNSGGYGQFSFQNKTWKSHRMSYMLFKGVIPNDREIDHLCKNRKCCNPEHLRLVSASDNLRNRNCNRVGVRYITKFGENIEDRIFDKTDIDLITQCWNFNGTPDKDGYGFTTFEYKTYKLHRFSHLLFKGEIPDGFVVDHLCKNRLCCNPEHLEAVSHSENMNRGNTGKNNHQSLKEYCPKGHKYTPENTYNNPKGSRECRICKTNNRQADRAKNLEKYRKMDHDRWLKKRHNT